MEKDLIEYIAKSLVDDPSSVSVTETEGERGVVQKWPDLQCVAQNQIMPSSCLWGFVFSGDVFGGVFF